MHGAASWSEQQKRTVARGRRGERCAGLSPAARLARGRAAAGSARRRFRLQAVELGEEFAKYREGVGPRSDPRRLVLGMQLAKRRVQMVHGGSPFRFKVCVKAFARGGGRGG